MAILDYIGGQLQTGAVPSAGTLTNYIVQSVKEGKKKVEMEDIDDADGALVTRLIFKRLPEIGLELVCKNAADDSTIKADFPEGDMCTVAALTEYYVDSCEISKTKSAWRASVTLTLIGIT